MQKDVIYIDVEDDITAIIGKLKASKHKIVAVVPPKHIGVLQSAVNLRLLARASKQNDKRLVLITSNQALTNLAASASIPVAKNLQTKPEIAEIAALDIDDGEDIIDGANLPIGDHAATVDKPTMGEALAATPVIEKLASHVPGKSPEKAAPPADGVAPKPKTKKGSRVPNFDTFRKKLLLIGAGVVLLIGFLVWAIVFAPRATVIVTARTTDIAVNQQVVMGTGLQTSSEKTTILAEQRTSEKEIKQAITASGEKNVGEKSKGSVTFRATDFPGQGKKIPAGTTLSSSSGSKYTTDGAATIPYSSNPSVTVGVTAVEPGASYNGATGQADGSPSDVKATFDDSTTGGTDKTAKIVEASDIESANSAVDKSLDEDTVKAALTSQFGDEYVVIDKSMKVDKGDLTPSVEAGQEAPDGKAMLEGTVNYSLLAVKKSELESYLKAVIENQLDDKEAQKVYDSGDGEVSFTNVSRNDQGIQASLSTNGKIGPKITEDQVKEIAAGKRFGEVQSELEAVNGIETVDVTFSAFWVRTVPNNHEKITVEFKVDG